MRVPDVIIHKPRVLATLAIILAAALAPDAAHAQAYGASYAQPAPLYPYVVQPQQNVYAAPPQQGGAYIIQVPAQQAYPYVRTHKSRHKRMASAPADSEPVAKAAPKFDRPHKRVDPELVDKLRKRGHRHIETKVVNTTRVVREKPIVIERKRYVDDPPIVIERRHVVEDTLPGEQPRGRHAARGDGNVRVIHAEAEVTILGPDRMSIRLFRKHGNDANAKAE